MSLFDNLNPKKIVTQAVHTVTEAPNKAVEAVEDAGKAGVQAAEQAVQIAKDAPLAAASGAKSALLHLLPETYGGQAKLPAYTQLDPAALKAAEARGAGQHYLQRTIKDENGHPHEPVSLVVSGTQAEVEQAFKKAGWYKADEVTAKTGLKTIATLADRITHADKLIDYDYKSAPVSDMYMDGKRHVMAFEKNNDNNHGRDHVRAFDTGKTDAQGRPIWEIAATRDTSFELNIKDGNGRHVVDHEIDHERDMAVADLLETGEVQDWKVVEGRRSEADAAAIAERGYKTDGKVMRLDLNAHPDLQVEKPHGNVIRDVIQHTPGPVRDAIGSLDQKLGKVFKELN